MKLAYEQISNEFYNTREQFKRVQDKMEKVVKERDEFESERKKLFENIVNLEQRVNDKDRDIELKDVKIESL